MLFEPHGVFKSAFGFGRPVGIGVLLHDFAVARNRTVEVAEFAVDVAHLEHREIPFVGARFGFHDRPVHLEGRFETARLEIDVGLGDGRIFFRVRHAGLGSRSGRSGRG